MSDQSERIEELEERNDVLAKVARDMRGALQSIADGIGGQKTAENALHRLTSRGIAGLDVDPEEVGTKGRIEELEAEVERLRKALAYADDKYDPVYPDFYILQAAADLAEDDEPGLADELRLFRRKLIHALDRAEDDTP